MRAIAAILAIVLAIACESFVKNTFVPAVGSFLAHHYYPRMDKNVVFYIALVTLAAIFYIILEILLHNFMKRRKGKARQA